MDLLSQLPGLSGAAALVVLPLAVLAGWKLKALCSPPPLLVDHAQLTVTDMAGARKRYGAAVGALGAREVMQIEDKRSADGQPCAVGMGYGVPDFWIAQARPGDGVSPVHLAFSAHSRAAVDAFYDAALAAGFLDNGPPGLRPQYHKDYYGAFVFDPDHRHNIEAVCHMPAMAAGHGRGERVAQADNSKKGQ